MKYLISEELSDKRKTLPEGYLLCMDVPIARTGELTYLANDIPTCPAKDGKVIVEREESSLFNEKTLSSFNGKPFVVNHPPSWDKNAMIDAENWKKYAAGFVQCVRRGTGENKDLLLADILVQDETAVGYINNGLRELSIGYTADFIPVAPGRAKQSNLRGNHVALVIKGRAGSRCAIGDSMEEVKDLAETKKSLMDSVMGIIKGLGLDSDPDFKEKISCDEKVEEKKEPAKDAEGDPKEELVDEKTDESKEEPKKDEDSTPEEAGLDEGAQINQGIKQVLAEIGSISDRVRRLEEFASKLGSVEEKEHGENFLDEKPEEVKCDEKDEEKEATDETSVVKDEKDEEKKEESKEKVQDEDTIQAFLGKVSILLDSPVDLPDPATDSAADVDKAIFEGKKIVLKKAMENPNHKTVITAMVGDSAIDELDPQTVNSVFRTACVTRHTTARDSNYLSHLIFATDSEESKEKRKLTTGEELGKLYNNFWKAGGDR